MLICAPLREPAPNRPKTVLARRTWVFQRSISRRCTPLRFHDPPKLRKQGGGPYKRHGFIFSWRTDERNRRLHPAAFLANSRHAAYRWLAQPRIFKTPSSGGIGSIRFEASRRAKLRFQMDRWKVSATTARLCVGLADTIGYLTNVVRRRWRCRLSWSNELITQTHTRCGPK